MHITNTSFCDIMPDEHTRTFIRIRSFHVSKDIGNLCSIQTMFCDGIRIRNACHSPALVFDFLELEAFEDEVCQFFEHLFEKL